MVDVPFFAPPRGEFDAPANGFGDGFGGAPAARFGGAAAPCGTPVQHGPGGSPFGIRTPQAEGRVLGLEATAGLGQAAVVLAVVFASSQLIFGLGVLATQTIGLGLAAVLGLLASVVFYATMLANWIVVALWLGRARRNAERIEPRFPQRRAAVWAWFGWIVPIAWFFVPQQYVTDVWTASARRGPRRAAPPLNSWWTAWIVSLLLGNISFRLSMNGDYLTAAGVQLVGALATFTALPLFRGVVRAITAAQQP